MGTKGMKGRIFGVITGPFIECSIGINVEDGICDAAVSCGV